MSIMLIAGFVIGICFAIARAHYEDPGLSPHFHLPKCMDVTIARHHYRPDAKTIDDSIGGFHIGTISNVRFGRDNETISFCFPLSPQLLACKIRKFGPKGYKVKHHVLRLHHSNFSAKLGDYFIDQEGNAFVCTEVIQADRNIPRCNFIILESDMYVELGNDSLYINSTESILERASYKIDSQGKVNVCYPLSMHALNCDKGYFYLFKPHNYNRMPNMKIAYKFHNNEEFSPSEYYSVTTHGDLKVCVSSSPDIEVFFATMYYVFIQISLICLCLTLIYQLKTRQSKLHDKCLACYNVSMIAHYATYSIITPAENCHAYFLVYFILYMSSLTWLTLTTFDIWKAFSKMKTIPNRQNFKKNKTFIYYSIVGWGSPFLWYVLVLITNHYYNIFAYERTIDYPICWFKTIWPFFAFYYGPKLLLNGMNIFFFIFTIRSIQREAKSAQPARRNGKKQVLIVCIKLFFIMGVSSIIEGIMMSIQYYLYFHYFYISGFFISTQGIAIFVVVICRRQAIRTIRNHFIKLKMQWHTLTINCEIFNRRNQTIYLVEENHLNLRSKQIASQCRTYTLNDGAEGDIFPIRKNIMIEHEVHETPL